jgi:hypothetical protein
MPPTWASHFPFHVRPASVRVGTKQGSIEWPADETTVPALLRAARRFDEGNRRAAEIILRDRARYEGALVWGPIGEKGGPQNTRARKHGLDTVGAAGWRIR